VTVSRRRAAFELADDTVVLRGLGVSKDVPVGAMSGDAFGQF